MCRAGLGILLNEQELNTGDTEVPNPLNTDLFGHDSLYLEVQIFSTDAGWETLYARQRLTSVAFAIKASDTDTLDGQHSTDFVQAVHAHSFSTITDSASDAQIPNNITINYVEIAGEAVTLNGKHAKEFALTSHNHVVQYLTKAEVDAQMANLKNRIAQLEALLHGVTRKGNNIEFK